LTAHYEFYEHHAPLVFLANRSDIALDPVVREPITADLDTMRNRLLDAAGLTGHARAVAPAGLVGWIAFVREVAIADLEATFTPSFKLFLDNDEVLFRPGDERVASLLLWHFFEEVEHRSSALVIYDVVVGRSWYRIRALPGVVKHLLHVLAIIANGVNEHVPLADRKVDARTLLPVFGTRETLRQKLPFGKGDGLRATPSAFSVVPRKQQMNRHPVGTPPSSQADAPCHSATSRSCHSSAKNGRARAELDRR
jgi:hypothetical protein